MKKSIKKKTTKEQSTVNFLEDEITQHWIKYLENSMFRKPKKLTKKQLEKQKKEERERKIKERKEEKRRAKKITMTVGEYEDALEEASYKYCRDW